MNTKQCPDCDKNFEGEEWQVICKQCFAIATVKGMEEVFRVLSTLIEPRGQNQPAAIYGLPLNTRSRHFGASDELLLSTQSNHFLIPYECNIHRKYNRLSGLIPDSYEASDKESY